MSAAADAQLLDSIEKLTGANQAGAEGLTDSQLEELAARLISGDAEKMRGFQPETLCLIAALAGQGCLHLLQRRIEARRLAEELSAEIWGDGR